MNTFMKSTMKNSLYCIGVVAAVYKYNIWQREQWDKPIIGPRNKMLRLLKECDEINKKRDEECDKRDLECRAKYNELQRIKTEEFQIACDECYEAIDKRERDYYKNR